MTTFEPYQYLGCCVDFPITSPQVSVEDLNQMIKEAKEISYKTLVQRVGYRQVRSLARARGWRLTGPCSVARNLGNSFHSSRICGHQCFFLTWSRIEFIWVAKDLWGMTKRKLFVLYRRSNQKRTLPQFVSAHETLDYALDEKRAWERTSQTFHSGNTYEIVKMEEVDAEHS